jgi:integrase
MYGCFLRPHREVRLLKRRHFNADCTMLSLGGNENKGKRIRLIRLPKYITRELLKQEIHLLDADSYLATGNISTFSKDYFKTIWTKVKRKLLKEGLVGPEHTLYSFRHTGAIEVYNKTKDPYKVQKAMFHSSLSVTLVYLRSLGLLTDNDPDDYPEL